MNRKSKLRITMLLAILVMGLLCFTGCGRISIGTGIEEEMTTSSEEEVIPGLPEGVWKPSEERQNNNNFEEKRDYVKTLQDETIIRLSPEDEGETYIILNKDVNMKRTGLNEVWTRVRLNNGSYYVKTAEVTPCEVEWASETERKWVNHVIFIDPAKQLAPDPSLEALFPGADVPEQTYDENGRVISNVQRTATSKEKMGASGQGVVSGKYEYEITLLAAYSLQAELIRRGYTVILSRNANNVNRSNMERALSANEQSAELYIRLSAGSGTDSGDTGILGMITTAANESTKNNYQKNYTLCSSVLNETSRKTGAVNNGLYQSDDLTSLNFCNMPAISLNIGYLSNEEDDKLLNDSAYLEKLAQGISDGIDAYFEDEN